jgi:hypothetical protein
MRWLSFTVALVGVSLAAPAPWAQEPAPTVRATVNGEAITSVELDARQYDLIGKDAIVKPVLDESRQLSRTPAVAQDLKGLMAAVVQANPDAPKEQIMAIVQEKSIAYTQTLAVRKVKTKLFADVESQALDQLIDEQLMLQEAKRQGVAADEAEVARAVEAAPKRAGADGEALHKLLVAWDKRALASVAARIKAERGWTLALEKKLGTATVQPDAAKRELDALRQAATIERK